MKKNYSNKSSFSISLCFFLNPANREEQATFFLNTLSSCHSHLGRHQTRPSLCLAPGEQPPPCCTRLPPCRCSGQRAQPHRCPAPLLQAATPLLRSSEPLCLVGRCAPRAITVVPSCRAPHAVTVVPSCAPHAPAAGAVL